MLCISIFIACIGLECYQDDFGLVLQTDVNFWIVGHVVRVI